MKLAILGFSREGHSLLKFLRHEPRFKNADLWVLDKDLTTKVPRGLKKRLGKNYLKNFSDFDLVFRSPGVPWNLPELVRARRAGTKFSSATKLFFDSASRRTTPIIGVTGTKGKGTTSTLLYRILKAAGKRVLLAGNIGKPALDILPKISVDQRTHQRKSASTFVILELSSFQLQDLKQSPYIAVVLDIFSDHLDAHKSLKEYYEAKANIARHQKKNGLVFYFRDNRLSRWAAGKSRGKKIGVDAKNFTLFGPQGLKLKGLHNFKNAVMAATVAKKLGVPPRTIRRVVTRFRGLEHRLEFVKKIRVIQRTYPRKSVSISFYNDSASTNPYTAAAAVRTFTGESNILIAGGYDKGLNYKPLAQTLKRSSTKLVALYGANRKKIAKAIRKTGVPIKLVRDLKTAVKTAYRHSRFYILDSRFLNIVLSPGSASFDQFENYADRGKKFKEIVRRLT